MKPKPPKFEYYDDYEAEGTQVMHLHLDICSISIVRGNEGVSIDVWEPEFEGAEAVGRFWVAERELCSVWSKNK